MHTNPHAHRAALGIPADATDAQVLARINELTGAAAAPAALHVAAREGVIAHAIRERKISASLADEYKRLYDANPVAIHNLLTAPVERGGLMAGINHGGDPFPEQPPEQQDSYPREWLGQQSRRGGTVTAEGLAGGSVEFEDTTTVLEATASVTLEPRERWATGSDPSPGPRITIGND